MKPVFIALLFAFALTFAVALSYAGVLEVGPGKAYSTIQAALTNAQPGDKVLVYTGTYRGTVSTLRDGASTDRIMIQANGEVVLRGGFNIEHKYITIEGFEITSDGQTAFSLSQNADYCEIINNNIHDFGKGRAITMPRSTGTPTHPTGCLIKGNWIHGQNNANLYVILGGANHVIEDNEIGPGVIREDAFRPFGDNHIIRNNYLHDITSGGGHTDVFQVFYIKGWRVRNLIFEKNTVINWEGQAWMVDCTPDSETIIIRNNIFQNIRGAGISYCPRTKVYNNVFHETGYGNVGRAVFIRSRSPRGSGKHSEIKNNIFSCTGGRRGGWYSVESEARSTFEADYNLAFPFRRGFNEAHGVNGQDPLFVHPSNSDFHLQYGSPAIDSGTTLSGFNDDKDGNTRSGLWDIGPYEINDIE